MPTFYLSRIRKTAAEIVNLMADKQMAFTEAEKTLQIASRLLHSNMTINRVEPGKNDDLRDIFMNG